MWMRRCACCGKMLYKKHLSHVLRYSCGCVLEMSQK